MINELVGKVVVTIENKHNTELIFTCSTGEKYRMYHEQDCCETVMIEDINGDLDTSDYGICSDCGDHCEYGVKCELCDGTGVI